MTAALVSGHYGIGSRGIGSVVEEEPVEVDAAPGVACEQAGPVTRDRDRRDRLWWPKSRPVGQAALA
jgi:hypothetical protein